MSRRSGLPLATLAVLVVLISGCGGSDSTVSDENPDPQSVTREARDWRLVADAQVALENESLRFVLDTSSLSFTVEDTATGFSVKSNPEEELVGGMSGVNLARTRSQLSLTYYDEESNEIILHSWTESVQKDQVEVYRSGSTVRVVYTLGDVADQRVLPELLPAEAFEEILANSTEEAARRLDRNYRLLSVDDADDEQESNELLRDYPAARTMNLYELRGVNDRIRRELEEYVRAAGYTIEDLVEDEASALYESEIAITPVFVIPVEYRLEGSEFVAVVRSDLIEFRQAFPLYDISFLQFFGAADSEATGYMLVPDGSGALINLNEPRQGTRAYVQRVYGRDSALPSPEQLVTTERTRLPVFGIKTEQGGVFAIIEDGEAMSSIRASLAGNVTNFNTVYATHRVADQDFLSFGNLRFAAGVVVMPDSIYRGEFAIRYRLFPSEQTDYGDWASYYREYLVETGGISGTRTGGDLPFYLRVTSSVEKTEQVLGFPAERLIPLTTFSEAAEMLTDLSDSGVHKVRMIIEEWGNSDFPARLRPARRLGGARGAAQLAAAAKDLDAQVSFDVEFQYVRDDRQSRGFSPGSDASRYITRTVASEWPYNPVTYHQDESIGPVRYVVSPSQIAPRAARFLESFQDIPGAGLTLRSYGDHVNSDFRENRVINRQESRDLMSETAVSVARKAPVTVSGGNAYALAAASHVVDVPLDSSNFLVTDASVPFLQMVLHGLVDYAGSPLNLQSDLTSYVLKSVEYGAAPQFHLIYRDDQVLLDTDLDGLFSVEYGQWSDEAVGVYARMASALGQVQGLHIERHTRLQSGLAVTTYEGGVEIVVNHSDNSTEYNGVTVPARDFQLRGANP